MVSQQPSMLLQLQVDIAEMDDTFGESKNNQNIVNILGEGLLGSFLQISRSAASKYAHNIKFNP